MGPAPITVGVDAFAGVGSSLVCEAKLVVRPSFASSFGGERASYYGLIVTLSGPIVTVSIATGEGTIESLVGPQDPGSRITITATPALGYTFVGWSGDFTGITNPLIYEHLDTDLNIQALLCTEQHKNDRIYHILLE